MLVAPAQEDIVGVEAVQALVVVKGTRPQVPESHARPHDDERGVSDKLPAQAQLEA